MCADSHGIQRSPLFLKNHSLYVLRQTSLGLPIRLGWLTVDPVSASSELGLQLFTQMLEVKVKFSSLHKYFTHAKTRGGGADMEHTVCQALVAAL